MLSRAEVAEVLLQFGLGTDAVLAEVPLRGLQGLVWRVETSTGVWAVKELLHRQSTAETEGSGRFQERVVRAGIPAPAVIRAADGQVAPEIGDRQVRVYSWVDVEPANTDVEPGRLGTLVAGIHQVVERSGEQPDPWYTQPVGAARWGELLAALTSAEHPQVDTIAELYAEQVALEDLLEPPAQLQQLHLDLWADNLRATPDGGLCVLDWDNSGPGDPRQELGVVLFEYCSSSPARARAVYDAYVEAGGPGRIHRPEDFSMAVAQLGHILEMQCEHWLDAQSADDRRVAGAVIDEFVERPLTRAVIREILTALA